MVRGDDYMRDKFWIVFIIFLVISITPSSASELGELNKEMKENNVQLDKTGKGVTQDAYNIKDYGYGIGDCIINTLQCLGFIAENSWKFWKWDDVWNRICQIGKNVYNIYNYIDLGSNEGWGTAFCIKIIQCIYNNT